MYLKQYFILFLFLITLISCEKKIKVENKNISFNKGWTVHQNDSLVNSGKKISTFQQKTDNWYKAEIPSTVMGVLTRNELYKDIFVGDNYKTIDKTIFNTSWWYRKEFKLDRLDRGQHVFLNLNGISYAANIWINGKQVADRDSIYGTFRQFSLDVTSFISQNNVLAIEVFRAQPGDPNIGFADWNPRPVDENMGIFRDISLSISGKVKLHNSYVQSKVNTKTLDEAWLTVGTEVENLTNEKISGEIVGKIESVRFAYQIVLNPQEKKSIKLTPDLVDELHIIDPRLWWCNNMGSPELYNLKLSFRVNNIISDKDSLVFGIREVESYINQNGDRAFKLNGKDVLLKGAGWTDDIFLRDTPERNETQVRYAKDMNLNLIRFENFWGNTSNIYDLCDKYGLLSIVGWSCQWEWEAYFGKSCSEEFGCIQSDKDIDLVAKYFEDQVYWLRNHPSIIAWMPGSDMLQKPELEERYLDFLSIADNRPYIGAAKKRNSTISGVTGTKMAGPYEYVGPNYWYIDSINGGAFGFNTETGIGAQLPVMESITKFIPKDKLWPVNALWNYHCTASATAMNSLKELTSVIDHKYGAAKDLDDYLLKADLINYDGTRAMFEAFRVNIDKTTGLVQWMLNSAWPSLYWQLYDYYMIPTASYYSVKKANEPLQLIYNYGDNSVCAVNESGEAIKNYQAIIYIYDIESKLIKKEEIKLDLDDRKSTKLYTVSFAGTNSFLFLELKDEKNKLLVDNVYALSSKPDEYIWNKTSWVHTPLKSYANFKQLSNLKQVKPEVQVDKKEKGQDYIYTIKIKNPSKEILFFTHLKLKDKEGNMLQPVFWSDNYISLMPGQEKTLKTEVAKKIVLKKNPQIEIKGWNSPSHIIAL